MAFAAQGAQDQKAHNWGASSHACHGRQRRSKAAIQCASSESLFTSGAGSLDATWRQGPPRGSRRQLSDPAYLKHPEKNMSTMAAISRPSGQEAFGHTTYTVTTTWEAKPSRCRFHSSLSCIDRAVMVSCPPSWTSTNGAQKEMSCRPGSLAWTARWPSTKMATESADR
ncbi:hypothetical protein SORBI_3004G092350 [Sorghum bicolor]|uniref:Uncharacterized protein n=1 Tax=Sorghum bicolor TaxID=4558 RepID=A0A194YPQ0_SORBI|nr:hypothetical protein SORBI_3004G092350 [Sorghum bicolor]